MFIRAAAVLLAPFALLPACGESPSPNVVAPSNSATAREAASGSAAPVAASSANAACSDSAYVASPVWSGRKPSLPPVPELPDVPLKSGDAFTVYGAVHSLNAVYPRDDLGKPVRVVGYIVDTNLARVDKCALHKTGVADPAGCKTELPSFTIGDSKTTTATTKPATIRVLGWASNFANVLEAHRRYQKPGPAAPYLDELWAVEVPRPLPATGARVIVTGTYGRTFTKSSAGIVTEPVNGVITSARVEVVEPAPQAASFPQLGGH